MSSNSPLIKSDILLDIGTGNGVAVNKIAPYVSKVIGIDKSNAMIQQTKEKENIKYIQEDATKKISFPKNTFDKIIISYMLHHLKCENSIQSVLEKAYNVIKHKGYLFIASPISPCKECKKEVEDIFSLKDHRLIFTEEDLLSLINKSKFNLVNSKRYIIQIEVEEWLKNSNLAMKVQQRIYNLHINASERFKKEFNMKIEGNKKCFIDTPVLLIEATK